MADGNKAMRDALEGIIGIAKVALAVNSFGNSNNSELWEIIDKCKSALAAPARNCDVGTAEEQEERFKNYTARHWHLGNTEFQWAQMPYEKKEGEAK